MRVKPIVLFTFLLIVSEVTSKFIGLTNEGLRIYSIDLDLPPQERFKQPHLDMK
jgi:hypothetical protein